MRSRPGDGASEEAAVLTIGRSSIVGPRRRSCHSIVASIADNLEASTSVDLMPRSVGPSTSNDGWVRLFEAKWASIWFTFARICLASSTIFESILSKEMDRVGGSTHSIEGESHTYSVPRFSIGGAV